MISLTSSSQPLLWIVDGVGLAIIAGCTVLDAVELWFDFLIEYEHLNRAALAFWLSGRLCQLLGLLLLIAYAATFQMFVDFERSGMALLTVGPLLNLVSCSLFTTDTDPAFLFNRRWAASELLELLGIVILDLSMADCSEELILFAELIGFAILGVAAMVDFDFPIDANEAIQWELRSDPIHLTDAAGLTLLTAVAVGQYFFKSTTHPWSHSDNNNNNNNSNNNNNNLIWSRSLNYSNSYNSCSNDLYIMSDWSRDHAIESALSSSEEGKYGRDQINFDYNSIKSMSTS